MTVSAFFRWFNCSICLSLPCFFTVLITVALWHILRFSFTSFLNSFIFKIRDLDHSKSFAFLYKLYFLKIILFIYFNKDPAVLGLHDEQGPLSSCAAQCSRRRGLCCWGPRAPGPSGYSSCNMWAQRLWILDARAQAPSLCMGLAVAQHVGTSQIRDGIHLSCTGRQILWHRATRDARHINFKSTLLISSICMEIYISFECIWKWKPDLKNIPVTPHSLQHYPQ